MRPQNVPSQSQTPAKAASAPEKPAVKPPEIVQTTPATPSRNAPHEEDRERLVAIAHKLEAAPLDPALAQEKQWAISWVVAAPDIRVRICPSLLADLRRPKYKYKSEMGDQLLISSAAFLIEHPEQAEGMAGQSLGGITGVLKAYSAIVKAEPQARARSLDDLLEKQRQGKLAETVQEIVKDCH